MYRILFYVSLFFVCFSCSKEEADLSQSELTESIRLNQIGYEPLAPKKAIIVGKADANEASLVDLKSGKTKLTISLSDSLYWPMAGQGVRVADFSDFEQEGEYVLRVGNQKSHPFTIGKKIYHDAFIGSVKGLYYQRMSMPLEEKYAGKWHRPIGHVDTLIYYHPSSGYSSGTTSSPGGWYDAGDYNKYTLNGAFPLGQLFTLYEEYPNLIQDNQLNIPESGNGKSDYLDELKYEMDWLLTMQDTDGGCFHKVTAKNFESMEVMPHQTKSDRYMVGKGTAATLTFAGAAAQASRVFGNYDKEYAENCLSAAKKAWAWAVDNPSVAFRNPKDIRTGQYGDNNFDDEFYWAAAELYASTGDENFLTYIQNNQTPLSFKAGDGWNKYMRFLGVFTLLAQANDIPLDLRENLTQQLINEADRLVSVTNNNDYFQPIKSFQWASNSDLLNCAMIMAQAYRHQPDEKYVDGIYQIIDYIFGKNATGYSFVTGFGDKPVMNIHHRQSASDGVEDPVPGLLSGGPNAGKQDQRMVPTYPKNEFPMQSWTDHVESYASNEICLNWNAPLTYVLGCIDAQKQE